MRQWANLLHSTPRFTRPSNDPPRFDVLQVSRLLSPLDCFSVKPTLLSSLRSHRLAIGLTLTALLAQLLLGTLSAAHQARMLGAVASAVCMTRGVERAADGAASGDSRVAATAACAVCAAAAASLLVGGPSATPPQAVWRAPQVEHVARAPQYRIARLRPPARAPPATA